MGTMAGHSAIMEMMSFNIFTCIIYTVEDGNLIFILLFKDIVIHLICLDIYREEESIVYMKAFYILDP